MIAAAQYAIYTLCRQVLEVSCRLRLVPDPASTFDPRIKYLWLETKHGLGNSDIPSQKGY